MAFYRTNHPTQELYSLVSIIFLLLATNLNSVQPLSFDFTEFTPGDSNITLQGDAQILDSGVIALTKNSPLQFFTPTRGRALYTTTLHLWDSVGNVASFVTSFSFVIETSGGASTDGLIFFIAPPGTVIPDHSTTPFLGVVDSDTAINRFVGVEFDLFSNTWDPEGRHIGIDINSLISTKTVRLRWSRGVRGTLTKVTIIYDAPASMLSAVVTYETGRITTISQEVDLKTVLPNRVSIGLSAASVTNQSYYIHSWSCISNAVSTINSLSDI